VEEGDASHLVRAERRDQERREHPGVGVELGQQPSDGEAAAFGQAAGLTEGPPQGSGIGHADAGALDEPGAVAAPGADEVGQGLRGFDHAA
jgi:hypothetical protein